MASPITQASAETGGAAATTSHTVNRPAAVAGRLVIFSFATGAIHGGVDWPAGYTELDEFDNTDQGMAWAYHLDDGTEGTTIAVSTVNSVKSCCISQSISGAENPSTQAPELARATFAATLNPNPPSITPTGGTKDYLFICGFNQDGEEADDDTWCTAAPANYGGLLQKTTTITDAASVNTDIATAERALTTAGPEDPGTFTVVQSLNGQSFTWAIHPAAAAAPGPVVPAGFRRQGLYRASDLW